MDKLPKSAASGYPDYLLVHFRERWTFPAIAASLNRAVPALPLICALLAPASTLYDIPALTQRWYTRDGIPIPDPAGSIALSATGLAFNAVANTLLVFRFSATAHAWHKTTVLASTMAWIVKSILAIINLALYGASRRKGPCYAYATGFWCAVLSAILAGINAVLLAVFLLYAREQAWKPNRRIQIQGRHFVLTELALFIFISIWALIFSRIEHWEYFDAIYFVITTVLTVGLGDFSPTRTSTQILCFPLALIGIALVASQVSDILSFFGESARNRKAELRRLFERHQQSVLESLEPAEELIKEMEYLQRMHAQENAASRLYDVALSLVAFSLFWFIGALVFARAEGWTYGTSLYFW